MAYNGDNESQICSTGGSANHLLGAIHPTTRIAAGKHYART